MKKAKRDSGSGLLIGLTVSALTPYGGARGSSQAEPSREAMSKVIVRAFAQPEHRQRITRILIDDGVAPSDVNKLESVFSSRGCREHIASKGSSNSGTTAIDKAAAILLEYAQPERLEVIYRKVRALPEDQIGGGRGQSEPKDVELVFDIEAGFFGRILRRPEIVGLDRSTIYEIFQQTVRAEGGFRNSNLRDGTRLAIKRANYQKSTDKKGVLALRVNASFQGQRGHTVDLSLPVHLDENTPEQVVVVALMTIASSPHFLSNQNFLRSEINALIFAADKMRSSLMFDSRLKGTPNSVRNLVVLENILKNLRRSAKGSVEMLLAVLIDSKILLGNLMNDQMLALQASGLNLKLVVRTDPTSSPINQNHRRVTVAFPARVALAQSSGSSDLIDPFFAYYYPWLLYPGMSPGNALYPWWVLEELTSYHGGPSGESLEAGGDRVFDVDLDRGLEHENFQDHPPSAETYIGPDGSVVVMDGLSGESSSSLRENLREEGFQLQDSVPLSLGESGISQDSTLVDGNTLRGQDSVIEQGGEGRDSGVTVITTTGENIVVTTTGDYTTTTTTGDYTTTTTTGSYTTTTTTGDYTTTTTTGDYTTTTTTGDY